MLAKHADQNESINIEKVIINKMFYSYKISDNVIKITAPDGLPSRLFWSINERLSQEHNLYEYYISNKHSMPNETLFSIKLHSFIPKYIYFFNVHKMYLEAENFTEDELLSEYKALSPPYSYEIFKRVYGVEWIDTMYYVAINTKEISWKNEFAEKLSNEMKISAINSIINSIADVNICVIHHKMMTITVNKHNLLAEIVEILKSEQ